MNSNFLSYLILFLIQYGTVQSYRTDTPLQDMNEERCSFDVTSVGGRFMLLAVILVTEVLYPVNLFDPATNEWT